MLQSPLDANQRYQYTVLVRTASEPGTHGINIQDSSTLVKQDREAMSELVERVTLAVQKGLARDFELRSSSSPAPAASEPVLAAQPAPSGGASLASVTRDFRYGEEPAGAVEGIPLAELVQDMGDLMYRLFMPEWVQRYLRDTSCSLIVTTNDLELPWELLYCNGKFLCLERPIARMPMGSALPRTRTIGSPSPGKLRFLLIYSDPSSTLPAAGREISLLAQKLAEEWKDRIDVTVLKPEDATGVRIAPVRQGSVLCAKNSALGRRPTTSFPQRLRIRPDCQ